MLKKVVLEKCRFLKIGRTLGEEMCGGLTAPTYFGGYRYFEDTGNGLLYYIAISPEQHYGFFMLSERPLSFLYSVSDT